jgi:threonine/homoserine/homoserine lactone efflux protein
LVAAVSLGDITVITLSVIGLVSLLAVSSTAFAVVKVIGGLYLIILGLRMIWPDNKDLGNATDESSDPSTNLFFNTWLITALNPKDIIFFGAFLPQFIKEPDCPTTDYTDNNLIMPCRHQYPWLCLA